MTRSMEGKQHDPPRLCLPPRTLHTLGCAVILETCRRGKHVNRIVMRAHRDRTGHLHQQEWHVCRFCKHERMHATRRVVPERNQGETA